MSQTATRSGDRIASDVQRSTSTLARRFEEQAARNPQAIALKCYGEQLSYGELNCRANQLAAYLQKMGVCPESRVALYLDRCIDMVAAILAVLKAGGCYVPIDLAYPRERVRFMLEDSGARVLITQHSLQPRLPSTGAQVVAIDSTSFAFSQQDLENPVCLAEAGNAAYVIYTSGSTGKPKGVVVTHHNVVRLLDQTQPWYGFTESDHWPLFHSYAFDVSVWELWGAFFNGGRLVVVPYLTSRSPAAFYELLEAEKITVLNQTPSAFRQLIWAEATAPVRRQLSLRYVICAGEALELQSLKPWFDVHGDKRPLVVNMYGITETTVHSTYRVIRREDLEKGRGSVIGVPIPDLQIHLVDEELRPVPKGVPGEICVGGAGVARGYLNRPELTAERFIPDPFSDKPGARLYRSGDLAMYTPESELEYLGRMDFQVKIRGFRVELGEIESALNRHPAIRESVVIAQDGVGGDKRLVAYYVPINRDPGVSELRDYLMQRVPEYMMPAWFMPLTQFPLNTNGKIDRRALPAPGGVRPDIAVPYRSPANAAQATLAEIWSRVLGVAPVGVDDNYFELGGDSIRSIQILAQAEQRGLLLDLTDIFMNPTVAKLVACARHRTRIEEQVCEPFSLISETDRAKLPADVEDAYPVSTLQLGMFFRNELLPESAVYHDVFSYSISAVLCEQSLREAAARVAQRHPLLRTSFHLAGFSEPLQLVHKSAAPPVSVDHLRGVSREAQNRSIVEWVEAEKRRAFRRETAPLVRLHAQHQHENRFQLFVSFHHACLDGWSLAAFVTELVDEYSAVQENSRPDVLPPRATYREFIELERQAKLSNESREFWQAKLASFEAQLLPRWPQRRREGGLEQRRGPEEFVPVAVFSGLRQLAQRAGVPLKTILLAAHQVVMSFVCGASRSTTALISNGRPEKLDGERVLGLFLNAVPLHTPLTGGTWLELVRQVYCQEQEVLAHRRFPMAEVQKLNAGRPVCETAFDFVHFHVYRNLQGRRQIDLKEGHYFEANDLTVYTTFVLDVTSTRLELHIDYEPSAICREQVEEMTGFYLRVLEAMADDPEARYDEFSPLTQEQTRRQVVDWNTTAESYEHDKGIHELFEAASAATPEADAIMFEDRVVTYADLNRLANRIALDLRRADVRPGSLVGICMRRSPEMVAALLGILKAGAAYVPLDPAFPADRLRYMLADCAAAVVLTEPGTEELLAGCGVRRLYVSSSVEPQQRNGNALPLPTQPLPNTREEALAYVIYTSGSTGRPKGVQVSHYSVINVLNSVARRAGFGRNERFLAVTTLSFDIAALELFQPLISGGVLILASHAAASDGMNLGSLIQRSRATVMQATPATWKLLIESGWSGSAGLKILCGGEALSRSLASELRRRAAVVFNMYGPTETTIWSTMWSVDESEPVCIGRPLGNTQCYVLDARRQLAPVGTAGELHIAGDGVARGYLNRPELSAAKFLPNSWGAGRLYRTGDLARYLPDGNLECLGRMDNQVKIHGFRIELGEIESVLREHPAIADAVATARPGVADERRLVAYLVPRNELPGLVELRDFLRAKLPAYMVPAQFVTLTALPLTANGKIDTRRLPAPEPLAMGAATYTPPQTPEEQRLAEIWADVLARERIGLGDDFFELGGDSLAATRVFARINQSFGTNLTLREVFENRTLASLAAVIKISSGTVAPRPVIPRLAR